jgi:uncharacterized protein
LIIKKSLRIIWPIKKVPTLSSMPISPARACSAIILVLAVWLAGCQPEANTVCIRKACVRVKLAQDQNSRETGLMFRKPLAYREGMLFVFERPDRYGFWMKNVSFPIDIIWISQNKTVVDMKSEVPLCQGSCQTYFPASAVLYVLEVSAGFARKEGIQIGDTVRF